MNKYRYKADKLGGTNNTGAGDLSQMPLANGDTGGRMPRPFDPLAARNAQVPTSGGENSNFGYPLPGQVL